VTAGERVRLDADSGDDRWPVLGTVRKVSPTGYVIVDWDDPTEMDAHFSPLGASARLTVVTGDDAKPRHRWDPWSNDNPSCLRCGVTQSDGNELEPCA